MRPDADDIMSIAAGSTGGMSLFAQLGGMFPVEADGNMRGGIDCLASLVAARMLTMAVEHMILEAGGKRTLAELDVLASPALSKFREKVLNKVKGA